MADRKQPTPPPHHSTKPAPPPAPPAKRGSVTENQIQSVLDGLGSMLRSAEKVEVKQERGSIAYTADGRYVERTPTNGITVTIKINGGALDIRDY